jgi:hypothetical protein
VYTSVEWLSFFGSGVRKNAVPAMVDAMSMTETTAKATPLDAEGGRHPRRASSSCPIGVIRVVSLFAGTNHTESIPLGGARLLPWLAEMMSLAADGTSPAEACGVAGEFAAPTTKDPFAPCLAGGGACRVGGDGGGGKLP